MNALQDIVLKFLQDQQLDPAVDKIAVACSGGIDSMVLVQLCLQLALNFEVWHFDHNLRDDSYKSYEVLQRFSLLNQFTLRYKSLKLASASENEARNARYEGIKKLASEHNIKKIFLGHTKNDQAETILFRLSRGTGLSGLSGIPVKRQLSVETVIYRPLLNTARSEIEAYQKAFQVPYYEDYTNQEDKYKRNLIRNRVLPLLEKVNPEVVANISNLATLVQENEQFLNYEVQLKLNELADLPWQLAEVRELPELILRRLIISKFDCHSIKFQDLFINAIKHGGFHRINYQHGKFFTIKQKKIWLELS
jgi:tRNA(Ile)-lysidine synthase